MPANPNDVQISSCPNVNVGTSIQPIQFKILKDKLGTGTYSEVRLAKNVETNQLVAVKVMDLTKNRLYFCREIRALTSIPPHKNIVTLIQYCEDENVGYIFTEFTQPKTLLDHILEHGENGLGVEESLRILDQLVDGVETIHNSNFSHSDLKPENVLYDAKSGRATIFDFGLSLELGKDGNVSDICGSPLYMAPEVLTQKPRHNAILSDVYCLGIIFYYMLVGSLPWIGVYTLQDLIRVVSKGKISIPNHLAPDVRDLLISMLKLRPSSRPGLDVIKLTIRRISIRLQNSKHILRS